MSVAIGANFFLVGDWFVRLNGGISELTQSDDETDESNSETGLFLGGGTGYEFFVTPAIAVGLCVDFQHQMYDDFGADILNLGIQGTWY